MPTSVSNFNLLAPFVSEIWRESKNKKNWQLLSSPDAPRDRFLHGAFYLQNAYQRTKFQLPSSYSFRDKENVPNFNVGATTPSLRLILKNSLRGICSFGKFFTNNFYQKFEIFSIFSYLSPHFYTHNVKLTYKRTDGIRNASTTENFVRISQGACQYCITPWG